jgi:hydroxymethylbilane synthase
MWSCESSPLRSAKPVAVFDSSINAVMVSRSDAWPEQLQFSGLIWTAGTKTWQTLAKKGFWVHGCFDGLGEHESTGLEALADQPLRWAKLTHEEGISSPITDSTTISTYQLEWPELSPSMQGKECFFWSSGSQFLKAMSINPAISDKFHGCGPGNTYRVICDYLKTNNSYKQNHVRIFLDQEDWRRQCTK